MPLILFLWTLNCEDVVSDLPVLGTCTAGALSSPVGLVLDTRATQSPVLQGALADLSVRERISNKAVLKYKHLTTDFLFVHLSRAA